MARRRNNERGTLFAIVILLLIFVAPLVILVGWLVTEVRAGSRDHERDDAKAALMATIGRAQGAANALWQEGIDEGLDLRQDEMFDGRSRAGRTLNTQIATEAGAAESAREELHGLLAPLVQRDAMRAAVVAWVVTCLAAWSMDAYRYAIASAVAVGVGLLAYKLSEGRRLGEAVGE